MDSPGHGKLSLHSSGQFHIDSNGYKLVTKGHYLLNLQEKMAGARHILSVLIQNPNSLPSSSDFDTANDYLLRTNSLRPFAMVFFAIPATRKLDVDIRWSFHQDDFDDTCHYGGYGVFNLTCHAIVWFCYRTKYMQDWPSSPQACYYDGHAVPLFKGLKGKEFLIDLRNPAYKLLENEFSISL